MLIFCHVAIFPQFCEVNARKFQRGFCAVNRAAPIFAFSIFQNPREGAKAVVIRDQNGVDGRNVAQVVQARDAKRRWARLVRKATLVQGRIILAE